MAGFRLIGGKPGPLEVEPARAEVGNGGMWESLADKDDLCINQPLPVSEELLAVPSNLQSK